MLVLSCENAAQSTERRMREEETALLASKRLVPDPRTHLRCEGRSIPDYHTTNTILTNTPLATEGSVTQ